MKTIIFGASGFIGRAVTAAAAAQGHETFGIVRSERSADLVRKAGGTPILGDLTGPETWRAAVEQADAVIQAAAAFDTDPAAAEEPWLEAMLSLNRPQGVPLRVVYTGGCWLYPARTSPPIDEATPFDPLPAFAYMAKNRARLQAGGLNVVTVHPGIVWSETGGFFGAYAAALREGSPIEIVGSAEVSWPLVHVEDLAALYLLALERAEPGTDYLGVVDAGVSVERLIGRVEEVCGMAAVTKAIPLERAIAEHGAWIAGQARSQRIETQKAATELRWRPERAFFAQMCNAQDQVRFAGLPGTTLYPAEK
ncbi:NAD-dependent epimerase/dehydratase family protein [Afifella pfennigii]|uniref:NAD-dependent epimerase/dehydratase family protein n=1 Tax=Afifella pfennigii TaxID=209897 RepID=UPI00068D57D4|nr:NAD-dependent epimerase/dehydratase family protein [Afifella pfennigii]